MANNFIRHGRRACELCHFKFLDFKFPKLVKNCPFVPQASISWHVPKFSSQKGCMNLSLKKVFSKYTANRDFPMQRRWNFVLFRQHPSYIFSKIVHGCTAEQEKKQVPSCSCLRSLSPRGIVGEFT